MVPQAQTIPLRRLRGPNRDRAIAAIQLVHDLGVELFSDQFGQACAGVPRAEGREILELSSGAFAEWLSGQLWHNLQIAASSNALRTAVMVLASQARETRRELENRFACDEDGQTIWIDLGRSAARVAADGWQTVPNPPRLFRQFKHQQPLPEPVTGVDLESIFEFLPPLANDDDRLMLLVWLVLVPVSTIPRPVLLPVGPQGSGKSTLSRMIRQLLDPSAADLLGRDPRWDLSLIFYRHAVPVFDNLDHLNRQEADIVCRGVTGGGISRRRLYSDCDEVVFRFRRAIVINGISIPTDRPDLLDRAIILHLDRLSTNTDEANLTAAFERKRPQLLGALLNVLSTALSILPQVKQPGTFRMADFARYGRAVAVALGHRPEQFDQAYTAAIGRQGDILHDDSLSQALLLFISSKRTWTGTATELLKELDRTARDHQLRRRATDWPKAPNALARRLSELQPLLEAQKICVTQLRRCSHRGWSIELIGQAAAPHWRSTR